MNTQETPTETAEQPKKDTKRVTIPARYTFLDSEVIELAKRGVSLARQYEQLERDFKSIKADYTLRLTGLENDRVRLDAKVMDGFEMRDTECEITFNDPIKGRKTTRRVDTGEVVTEEPMSPFDLERELPLKVEQPAKPDAVLPDEPSDVMAVDAATITPSEPCGTNIGTVITNAAVNSEAPQVIIPNWDEEDWGPKSIKTAFKKAATAAGWSVAALNTLMEAVKGNNDVPTVKATLAPHVKGAKVEPVIVPTPEPTAHIPGSTEEFLSKPTPEIGAEPTDTPFDDTPVVPTNGHFADANDPLAGIVEPDGFIRSPFGLLERIKIELPSEDMLEKDYTAEMRNRLNNAAVVASWPEAAIRELNKQTSELGHRELVKMANRFSGKSEEVQP